MGKSIGNSTLANSNSSGLATSKIDSVGEVKNSVGNVSVLGNSTKFYCGK